MNKSEDAKRLLLVELARRSAILNKTCLDALQYGLDGKEALWKMLAIDINATAAAATEVRQQLINPRKEQSEK